VAEEELREFDLIRWIRGQAASDERVRVGIGDDAAVVANRSDATLITTDMLVDGVHFDLREAPLGDVGWKAMACSVSDVAAMGGRGTVAVVSAALPKGFGPEQAEELVSGMLRCADEFGVCLVGGDLTGTGGPLAIAVTMLGDTGDCPPILRSGAQVGDAILVTGALGGSALGHHMCFWPRQAEAVTLNSRYRPHAMIDVSDGLAIDLHHILEESAVGALVWAKRVPVAEAAVRAAAGSGHAPLEHALGDGEDYELLFTADAATAERLLADQPFGVPVSRIGEIVPSGAALVMPDGAQRRLEAAGWEHFR